MGLQVISRLSVETDMLHVQSQCSLLTAGVSTFTFLKGNMIVAATWVAE